MKPTIKWYDDWKGINDDYEDIHQQAFFYAILCELRKIREIMESQLKWEKQ